MANEDVIAIQRDLADKFRAQEMAKQQRLKKDVRSQIAKAGHYNPDNDPVYEFHEFPKYVLVNGVQKVAHTKEEEDYYLGKEMAPPKKATVDIADLGQQQTVEVAKPKRGRPAKALPLPESL